ncbi:papain family cysteine protease, partial [Ancylostoma ceylanicum]
LFRGAQCVPSDKYSSVHILAFFIPTASDVDPRCVSGNGFCRKTDYGWYAEYSPEAEAFVKARIMDSKFLAEPKKEEVLADVYGDDPPDSFDARTQWPECRSIGTIRDQSACGSCWAVSSAEAMSDEICVQSNSTIKVMISDTDILSCCGLDCGYGCQGGWPIEAYRWMQRDGVVTGGKYRQRDVCKPYSFYPCGQHKDDPYYGPCPQDLWPTPKCRKSCQRKYKKSYQEDKYFATRSYFLPNNERSIRQEIYKNGPVVAAFKVYQDFSFYRGGIYVMWILAVLVVTALAAKPTTVEEFLAQPVDKHVEQLSGQAFVDYINEHQSFYKAEYSPEAEAFVKARIMDSKFLVPPKKEEVLTDVYGDDPPARLSSYICLPIQTSFKVMISDTDILSCCGLDCGYGCQGGWPIEAYRWMQRDGVVTGGKYRQKLISQLSNSATRSYFLPNNERSIRQEIYKNGPVVAAFKVYQDFSYYKGGIY